MAGKGGVDTEGRRGGRMVDERDRERKRSKRRQEHERREGGFGMGSPTIL